MFFSRKMGTLNLVSSIKLARRKETRLTGTANFGNSIEPSDDVEKDGIVDVKSLGLLAIHMKQKVLPEMDSIKDAIAGIGRHNKFNLQELEQCSPEFLDFLEGCFPEDGQRRSISKV